MAVDVEVDSNEHVRGVQTYFGVTFYAPAVVLTTGTFMNGKIWVGRKALPAGRAGEAPSVVSSHFTTLHLPCSYVFNGEQVCIFEVFTIYATMDKKGAQLEL